VVQERIVDGSSPKLGWRIRAYNQFRSALHDGEVVARADRFEAEAGWEPGFTGDDLVEPPGLSERVNVPTPIWSSPNVDWNHSVAWEWLAGQTRVYLRIRVNRTSIDRLWPVRAGDETARFEVPSEAEPALAPASPTQIKTAMSEVYRAAKARGFKPPNVREIGKPVVELLRRSGVTSTPNHIQELASTPEFAAKRQRPGRTLKGTSLRPFKHFKVSEI
jgi:hypothetical protein